MEDLEYKCYYENCNKSYKTKYNLRRHINSNHLYIKEFACVICSKTFASKQNLQGHERLHKQKVMMPELEIPKASLGLTNSKHEDIRELLLSKFYQEPKLLFTVINNNTKAVMPILPPVCTERSATKGHLKLPVIPILL